ncbi:hypothetical protein ACFLWU_03160 [Chloroflexota bacterium]
MRKLLFIIFVIGFITLSGVCFYLKTQIDTARNDILNLTSLVNLQEVKITETESELDLTQSSLRETEFELDLTENSLKETESELIVVSEERNEVLELNEDLEKELINSEKRLDIVEANLQSQTARTFELQTEIEVIQVELEAMQEELQLYHDTGISVAQGIVPPYRTSQSSPPYNLENNIDAGNVSWSELKYFLLEDRTDNKAYVNDVYMCGDFAADLHNNAENGGIKAALAAIDFEDGSTSHALNAFVTTDRGLVFIDTTGVPLGNTKPYNFDRVVTVSVGESLDSELIFTMGGWYMEGGGSIVSQVKIYW